ncbi:hypothetical protein [Variovorax paradoxus]|uniref:Uncharacterized protein n=1 Tax=Variovorax paradoxus TaxID=34073 RepID=A0A679J310_VARPD|nr:hypothetical protein VVAX_04384 [Variovorax paradoxus]
MTTTPTAPLTLEAAPEQLKVVAWRYIPSRIWSDVVLTDKEDRAKLAIEMGRAVDELVLKSEAQSALTAQAATIAQLEARLREAEADARRWDFVRHHWSHAQMRWNNDATNSLKSIVLTIKTAHWTSAADAIESQIDAAIAAHGKDST